MSTLLTAAKPAPAASEDSDDIEKTEHPISPSSDAVPVQPSVAVDEPVATSSAEGPRIESSAQGPRQAEGTQSGKETHKYGYVVLIGVLW